MAKLEDDLKHIRTKAEEADKQYDEVSKKLQVGGSGVIPMRAGHILLWISSPSQPTLPTPFDS